MDTIKVERSGDRQFINIPAKYELKEKEVYIKKVGESLVILPKHKLTKDWFDNLNSFSKDFMNHREQPEHQEREAFE
jgi:antitoxin VapB